MSWTRFFRRAQWDAERARELAAHLEIETDENIARGMSPAEARAAARRKLGNVTSIREDIYQMNTLHVIDTVARDLQYGARLLWRNPAVSIVAILSLALGIGANTAIFQLIDALRLRPLPVARPAQLAEIRIADMEGARGNFNTWRPSVTNAIWERIKTLRVALLAGRDFDNRDTTGSPRVAIVNTAFARQVAGSERPVGKRFWIEPTPRDPQLDYEIVGIVADTKYEDLRDPFRPIAFLSAAQDPRPGLFVRLLVRSALPPDVATAAMKRAVAEVSPQIVVSFQRLDDQIRDTLLRDRLMAALSAFFGALAGLLATIGLYGVIAYMVVQRRNEIGIRVALGASRTDVVRMILREAALLLAAGVAIGTAFTAATGQLAGTLLFDLRPADPVALGTAVVLLALVTAFAAYLPARRAAAVEPMAALREE